LLSLLLLGAASHCATPAPPVPEIQPVEVPPPKIALVLGGGGARGFAHVGVLEVLERAGISVDMVIGTSVGSLIGALYAANPKVANLRRVALALEEGDLFDISLFSASRGPVKGDAIRRFVRDQVGAMEIETLRIPFIAIAADLNTGERVEIDHGPIVDAVRASVSIPGVFVPARMYGRNLIDGGVVANLPVDVARARGADLVIAVNITEGVHDESVDDLISIVVQAINIMMSQMTEEQLANADVVITPAVSDVGTLDFGPKMRCLDAGIQSAAAALPQIHQAIADYYRSHGGEPPQPPGTATATAEAR